MHWTGDWKRVCTCYMKVCVQNRTGWKVEEQVGQSLLAGGSAQELAGRENKKRREEA